MSKQDREDVQVLKCRDDKTPLFLCTVGGEAETEPTFQLAEGTTCSWLSKDDTVGPDKLRPRIEPWLTALFQSEHMSLLIGSGLTHALHKMATGEDLPGMTPVTFSQYQAAIDGQARKSAETAGREAGNIEDQIRVANELLRGLEIAAEANEKLQHEVETLRDEISSLLKGFAQSILDAENAFITANTDKLQETLNYLVSFLMSFASRAGTRDRLQVFTTNYDRCIELGAEIAGLHLLDRFVGSLAPIFRSSRLDVDMHYNPPGIHGRSLCSTPGRVGDRSILG
jgi:hypothetical protein